LPQVKYFLSRLLACSFKEFFMKSKQSGFTLVEIAIVLVIVGLLLGGVLKGQELITSSKAKALFADKAAFQTAYNMYNDRYRAVPGDDLTASARFSGLSCGVLGASASQTTGVTCMNGDGNGAITAAAVARITAAQGAAIAVGGGSEVYKLFQHLRAAQMIKTEGTGPGEIFVPPTNSVGGWTGVQSTKPFVGQQDSLLYFVQFATPGAIGSALDAANDDGFTNRGGIRAADNGTAALPNSATTGVTYGAGAVNQSTNLL
jgi:prepilin-type N-terminal cleavage/methylation domain-containing protein